ncbi:MAG: tetratricopeptide repeat protein [Chthonomonas sp.]|nr:tetratricopeptide repeat protein [Chthonomonas sp.]
MRPSILLAILLVGCQSGESGGVPIIRTAEHYNQTVKEAEQLSRAPLTKYERGETLTEGDKESLKKARLLFQGMRDYSPVLPNSHFALGKITRALGDDTAAFEHFQQVVTLLAALKEPKDLDTTLLAEAHGELSRILILNGEVQSAGEQADYARQLRPDDPRYQVDQASVLIQAKREREAKQLLERVLSSFPGDARAKSLYKLLAD